MLEDLISTLNFLCIIALGIATSYDDMRENRIRNRYIAYALLFGVCTNIMLPAISIGGMYFSTEYFRDTLLNAAVALVAGFVFWSLKIWRAGDGKLFFTYAFLIPLSVYIYGYVPLFPAFSLLVNLFIFSSLLILSNLWVITDSGEKSNVIRRVIHPWHIIETVSYFLSIQWLISFLPFLWGIDPLYLTFGIMLLLTLLLSRFHETALLSIAIALLRLFLDYGNVLNVSFITNLAVITFSVLLVNFVVQLGSFRFNDRISISRLAPGMRCAERIARRGRKYVKCTEQCNFLKLNYDSLSQKDVNFLKKLQAEGKLGFDEITVKHTMPIAPFMFLAVIITLLIRSDIVTFLRVVSTRLKYIF